MVKSESKNNPFSALCDLPDEDGVSNLEDEDEVLGLQNNAEDGDSSEGEDDEEEDLGLQNNAEDGDSSEGEDDEEEDLGLQNNAEDGGSSEQEVENLVSQNIAVAEDGGSKERKKVGAKAVVLTEDVSIKVKKSSVQYNLGTTKEPRIEDVVLTGNSGFVRNFRLNTAKSAVVKKIKTCIDTLQGYQNVLKCNSENVIRVYEVKSVNSFTLMCLEDPVCCLNEVLHYTSHSTWLTKGQRGHHDTSTTEMEKILESWGEEGYVSALKLKIIKDLLTGLIHIHRCQILHRNLTPYSIEVSVIEGELCGKISGFQGSQIMPKGLCSYKPIGGVLDEWKAPEQLSGRPERRETDIFCLGMVIYMIICNKNPFQPLKNSGEELVKNIQSGTPNLNLIKHREASLLVEFMLKRFAPNRLPLEETLRHPVFWNQSKKLSFYRDVCENDLPDFAAKLSVLNRQQLLGQSSSSGWKATLGKPLLEYLTKKENKVPEKDRKTYDDTQPYQLIKLIRNIQVHYYDSDVTQELKDHIGGKCSGLFDYFDGKFPNLFIQVYRIIYEDHRYRKHEGLKDYF